MKNLEMIGNERHKNDLLTLQKNVIDILLGLDDHFTKNSKTVSDFLYRNVIGIGYPICICEGGCWFNSNTLEYEIEVIVDYAVSYQYTHLDETSQEIDEPIHLMFNVGKSELREVKLEQIGI